MLSQGTGRSALPQESPRVMWWWSRILGSWVLCWPRKWRGGQTRDDSAPLQQRDREQGSQISPVLTQDVFTKEMYYPKVGLEISQDGGSSGRGALCCLLDPLHQKLGLVHTASVGCINLMWNSRGTKRMLHHGAHHLPFYTEVVSSLQSPHRARTPQYREQRKEGNHEINPGVEDTQNFRKQNVAINIGLWYLNSQTLRKAARNQGGHLLWIKVVTS